VSCFTACAEGRRAGRQERLQSPQESPAPPPSFRRATASATYATAFERQRQRIEFAARRDGCASERAHAAPGCRVCWSPRHLPPLPAISLPPLYEPRFSLQVMPPRCRCEPA